MPDSKITALTSISTSTDPANDPLVIVDVSDTSMTATGTTKKVTLNQLLGASGTATLASATITGDLTVDTSTLYVSSSSDKVGIGTTSLSNEKLTVAGNISANGWLGRANISVPSGDCSIFRPADNTLGFGIASTTAMTLNSTGLGVGTSPAATIHAYGSGSSTAAVRLQAASGRVFDVGSTGSGYGAANNFIIYDVTAGAERLRIDASGNVGIGVTPSASGGCLQLKSGITFPATQVASTDANTLDDYVETTFSPTIVGSTVAGTATYTTQIGRATKIGRLVTFSIRVVYSAGTGIGNLRVGNLPFAAGAGSVFAVYAENIALTAGNYPVCGISSGNTFISIDQLPTGGGSATAVPYDAAGDIQISGSYIV